MYLIKVSATLICFTVLTFLLSYSYLHAESSDAEIREAILLNQLSPPLPVVPPLPQNLHNTKRQILNNKIPGSIKSATPQTPATSGATNFSHSASPDLPAINKAPPIIKNKIGSNKTNANKAQQTRTQAITRIKGIGNNNVKNADRLNSQKKIFSKEPAPKNQDYNTEILSKTIYKRQYSRANTHLPKPLYLSDYDNMMFIAAKRGDVNALRALLDAGRNIHMRNINGETPLITSLIAEKLQTARLLLMRGADPNMPAQDGVTPLQIAAYTENEEMVRMLLAAGANTTEAGNTNKSPALEIASARGNFKIVRLLEERLKEEKLAKMQRQERAIKRQYAYNDLHKDIFRKALEHKISTTAILQDNAKPAQKKSAIPEKLPVESQKKARKNKDSSKKQAKKKKPVVKSKGKPQKEIKPKEIKLKNTKKTKQKVQEIKKDTKKKNKDIIEKKPKIPESLFSNYKKAIEDSWVRQLSKSKEAQKKVTIPKLPPINTLGIPASQAE